MSVLVIGEALVDVLLARDGTQTRSPGGSPLNVAVTLGRLGESVTLHSVIGDDADGQLIARHLAASGVAVSGAVGGRTSTAVASVRADGAAEYEFDIEWRLGDESAPRATHVHAGSVALFLEPGAAAVARMLRDRSDAIVSVDPNIRPGLVGSPHEARLRFDELLAHVDVVKMSDEDAAWLYPGMDAVRVMHHVQNRGVRLIALTRGGSGATLMSGAAVVDVAAAAVKVADTVGAGDTFMGALLYGLSRQIGKTAALDQMPEWALHRLGQFACAAAAITVSRKGADPPTFGEVKKRLAEVHAPG